MKTHQGRTLCGASLALLASTAIASPVVLDSEQKAAAGVSAALHTSHNTPLLLEILAGDVLEHVDRAMKTVNSRTTAADLIATRGGVTIACDVAGSLTAKMADALPRVLRLSWNGCVNVVFWEERTFNGTAAVTLPSDTLAPDSVDAIRLGNQAQPFVEQFRQVTPEQIDNTTLSYDVSLRGDISMIGGFAGSGRLGEVIGSSYELHGYRDEQRYLEFPSDPPVTLGAKISAHRAMIIATTTMSDDGSVVDEDLQALDGSLTFAQSSEPYLTTETFKFNGYRVRKISDWTAFSSQLFVDGKINITWNPYFGAGCMDGVYSFRTRAPMIMEELNTPTFGSGELVVNGSVIARFFSAQNVPPTLPTPVNGMLINIRVPDVGRFNYDAASLYDVLPSVGQCQM